MGQEREVVFKHGREKAKGRALLEASEIVFRSEGGGRVRIPLAGRTATAREGVLVLEGHDSTYELTLGDKHAAAWAKQITSPKTVVQKLGLDKVKTLRIVGTPDPLSLTKDLAALPDLSVTKTGNAWDACLLFITKKTDLSKLTALVKPLAAPRTFLWIVYPKGKPNPKEADVRAAGLAAGLVDIKVASVSTTQTALKFTSRKT
jgi:hypothetical protein